MDENYLTMIEAAKYAKVSRVKIWRMVRDGKLQSYANPRDGREHLVRQSDLDVALKPTPISAKQVKIAA